MEANLEQTKPIVDEDEYILLDLDDVCLEADIQANAPYVLSGLDTLNPVLVIGNRLKLIGEYQETIGTCYLFSEKDGETLVTNPETDSSEKNLKDKYILDSNEAPYKQVHPITGLHKVLKFRLANENEEKRAEDNAATDL